MLTLIVADLPEKLELPSILTIRAASLEAVGVLDACVRACVARISSRQRTVVESVKQVY